MLAFPRTSQPMDMDRSPTTAPSRTGSSMPAKSFLHGSTSSKRLEAQHPCARRSTPGGLSSEGASTQ